MVRFRRALVVTSSLAVAGGLLVGVAPVAVAAQPPAAQPAAQPATVPTADEDSTRRGDRIVNLRGDVCARVVPLGLVRFEGPGGTRLTARVRAQGDAKLLTIVSGSGRIGENTVRPRDVSGELTWRKGAMRGSVTIKLPDHVKVSRTWAQEVSVTAQPIGCGFWMIDELDWPIKNRPAAFSSR